jgi:hypothetical protein
VIGILAAAALVLTSLGIHYRQWRRGATGQFILAVFPAALLFVILPVPVLALRTIQEFGRIGAEGMGTKARVVAVCMETDRLLGIGSLGCLVAIGIAALLQGHAASAIDAPESPDDPIDRRRSAWAPWLLAGCAFVALPAALVVSVAEDIPRLTIRALELSEGATAPESPTLSSFSQQISSRLIASTVGGTALAGLGLAATVAALVAAGRIRQPRRRARYAWAVLGAVALATTGNAVRLLADLRWIDGASAAALAKEASTGSMPRPMSPRVPPSADRAAPLRFDGVYRRDQQAYGAYRYWFFEPGGRCWPYETPAEDAPPPPPPPPDRYWTWQADAGTLTLTYSEHDAVVRTERGSIASRDALTIDGGTYRFVDRARLRRP